MENIYPAGPQGVPDDLAQPSSVYKRRAWLAMASLSLFLALYIALAGWFGWTAYRTSVDVFVTGRFEYIFIAAGAAFLALVMLKALCFVQKGSAPDAIEVTAVDQPRLFEFLNHLADEAGAPRPARVFLSARVNVAVFYNLSIINLTRIQKRSATFIAVERQAGVASALLKRPSKRNTDETLQAAYH